VGPEAAAVADAAVHQAKAAGLTLEVVQPTGSTAEEERRAKDGDVDALLDGGTVTSKDTPSPALLGVLEAAHRQVLGAKALSEEGIDPAKVGAALDVPPLAVVTATSSDPRSGQRRQVAFVATIVLYGQIVGYGFWVAVGVVEEKSSRVVEVLLATVRPRVLLSGKIIGIGVLGLVQLLGLGIVAVLAGVLSGGLTITTDVLGVLVVVVGWFLLGYSFYAALFAAAAARVSRQEDVQNVTTPLTMLLLVSFFGALYAANDPGSTGAFLLSVVPPFSALVSPPRIAAGSMPAAQVVLAITLMVLAVVLLVRVAARLYEGAVLRTGGRVSWRDAWRGVGR
jgi:ABC-2 type transport system permease protein